MKSPLPRGIGIYTSYAELKGQECLQRRGKLTLDPYRVLTNSPPLEGCPQGRGGPSKISQPLPLKNYPAFYHHFHHPVRLCLTPLQRRGIKNLLSILIESLQISLPWRDARKGSLNTFLEMCRYLCIKGEGIRNPLNCFLWLINFQ